jgi:tetratricopeptide (TPR) repeat protein
MALRANGHNSDAIPSLQAAVLQVDGSDNAPADVLRSLAAAQADSGNMEAAVSTYSRAVQQAEAAGKALEVAQARRDLGLAYQRRGELASAINEWTAALAIYDLQHANSQVARLHCDIGNARRALGQRQRSMKDYEQGLMLLNSLNGDQETRGLILSNAANAYAEQGDAESADAFFTEAITIAEQLGDQVAETTRNGNYGWFLLLVGRPRRAIATLERALNVSQPLHLTLQSAIQLDNLGLVYDSLGDIPAALERHRQALAQVSGSGDVAMAAWAAQFKVNLANTLINARSYDEAQTLLDDAVEQGRTSGSELLIAALTGQARLWLAREQPAAAEDALSEAILLARKLDNRRLLAEALNVRSQQQAVLAQDSEAAATWEEAQRLYLMLHMPQGKQQPLWLTRSATRT